MLTMQSVHYAYGNIKLRQKHLEAAWRDYDTCLKICLQNMSIHPLTAATYYSLGRIEFLQGHSETARYAIHFQIVLKTVI